MHWPIVRFNNHESGLQSLCNAAAVCWSFPNNRIGPIQCSRNLNLDPNSINLAITTSDESADALMWCILCIWNSFTLFLNCRWRLFIDIFKKYFAWFDPIPVVYAQQLKHTWNKSHDLIFGQLWAVVAPNLRTAVLCSNVGAINYVFVNLKQLQFFLLITRSIIKSRHYWFLEKWPQQGVQNIQRHVFVWANGIFWVIISRSKRWSRFSLMFIKSPGWISFQEVMLCPTLKVSFILFLENYRLAEYIRNVHQWNFSDQPRRYGWFWIFM